MLGRSKAPTRPGEPTLPSPEQAPDLPYDLAVLGLQRQLETGDTLDAKVSNAFTWAGALAALVAAVMALKPKQLHGWTLGWFVIALIAGGSVGLLTGFSTAARRWRTGPTVEQLIGDYRAGTSETAAKWKVVRNLIGSAELNRPILSRKANLLHACYAGLALELTATIAALIAAAG